MTSTLYLNGTKAYRADTCGNSPKVNKSDFAQLVEHLREFDVILLESTAPKYAEAINRLGFILTSKEVYNTIYGELKLHYVSVI